METLAILFGTYVITLVLTESDGAFGILHKFRNLKWVDDFGLFNCHLCTSFWVALALSLAFAQPLMVLIAWAFSTVVDKIVTAIVAFIVSR